MKSNLTLGKRVIYTPAPFMQGNACLVPEPIRGTITEIRRVSPINPRIAFVIITDKNGNTHKAYESQICTKYPTVYSFI